MRYIDMLFAGGEMETRFFYVDDGVGDLNHGYIEIDLAV